MGFNKLRHRGTLLLKELAALFAGVEGERDDDYYMFISYYPSSREYNVDVLRDARFRYPDDREKQQEYFEANGYFDNDGWEWQDLETMEEYGETRTASRQSYRRAVLTTGFAALNRLVSILDVYLTHKAGQDKSHLPQLGVDMNSHGGTYLLVSVPICR